MLAFWIRADLDEAAFRGDELRGFGPATLDVFKKEKLLKRGEDLRVVECGDCGNPHLEDVDVITDSSDGIPRAYIACGAGRVSVRLDDLQVWAIDFDHLVHLVAATLGLSGRAIPLAADRVWMVGTGQFLDRTREVFLIRGVRWPDATGLLENNARLAASPCPLILCLNRVPEDTAWFSAERVMLSLAEFDWLVGDRATLLNSVIGILREHRRPVDQVQRAFRLEGDFWSVRFGGKLTQIKNGKGAQYLSYLLNEPDRDFSATDLIQAVSGKPEVAVRSSAGEVLDDQAITEYRAKAESLQAELEEARKFNDAGRVEQLQEEMELLGGQITSATGLGGRRRSVGDSLDRARKAVSIAIARTITQIRKADDDLGDHLDRQVARGAFLSYRGDGTPWNS